MTDVHLGGIFDQPTHHGTIMANKAQFGTYFVWLHAIKYDSYMHMYTHHVKPGDLPVADQTLLHRSKSIYTLCRS